ncbi:hypothetical protein [Salmonirosea aquatica]|uniref:Uncharacterized protein n=1 Tax=Salmonirosea aquatica TaxID=2654236 RepID=A0A7C9FRB3_9BACT|nr:hypothetical protein [Cytophagaceae bacterium SJW1-29]
MRNTYLLSLTLLLVLSQGCLKDHSFPDPEQGLRVSGKVLLPTGSKIDVNTLFVNNGLEESKVTDQKYSIINPSSDFTFRFLLNANQNIIMMGYNYPEQNNYDISVRSTAIGLIMNVPSALSLTKEGKLKTINFLLSSPLLVNVEKEIEKVIFNKMDLFDITNKSLAKSVSILFTAASARISVESEVPVNTFRAGTELTLVNNARSHKTIVGIYKDGVRQKIEQENFLTIDEVEFVPASLSEIANSILQVPEIKEYKYEMKGEGKFELRYRTGRPGESFDNSDEAKDAFLKNVKYGVSKIGLLVLNYLPIDGCASLYGTIITNRVAFLINNYSNKNIDAADLVIDVLSSVFLNDEDVEELTKCLKLEQKEPGIKFLKNFGKMLRFVGLVNTVGSIGNATLFGFHWDFSISKMDKCYTIEKGVVKECDQITKDFVLSGGPSPSAEIGADDDFEIYLNSKIIFQNMDGVSNGSPALKFQAATGDTIRIVGYNTIPPCAIITPFYLHIDNKVQILTTGYPQNCSVATGVFFDKSFTIEL